MRAAGAVLACILALSLSGCSTVPSLPIASEVSPSEPPGLTLRWLGTSTVTVSDGRKTVMVDAFLSRTGKTKSLLAFAGLPMIEPNPDRLEQLGGEGIPGPVDAIFVSHSHHDHVLDVAYLARKTHAAVYGSDSSRRVVSSTSADVAFDVVGDGANRCVGLFNVRVIGSPHKPTALGPAGEVDAEFSMPSRLREFRSGASFAFSIEHPLGTVLVIPSAVISPDKPPHYPSADVVLMGAGLMGWDSREGMRRYWNAAVGPRTVRVHPIHWDDFTRPLPLKVRPLPFSDMEDATDAMKEYAAGRVELSYLPLTQPVRLPRFATNVQNWPCPG